MAPLVAAEVDLRDFGFMPLDVLRLRDSDLMALSTGDEFKAAVALWCVAWHQVPAASLPNDDRLLAPSPGRELLRMVCELHDIRVCRQIMEAH